MTRSAALLVLTLAIGAFAQAPPPAGAPPSPGGTPGAPGNQKLPGSQGAPGGQNAPTPNTGAPKVQNPPAANQAPAPGNPAPAPAPVQPGAVAGPTLQFGTPQPGPAQTPNNSGNGFILTLQDAFARARQYGYTMQGANINIALAREDRKQALAATLPSVSGFNQFIYTEGNGTPSGVFVANDGVHVYNEQIQVHEELLSLARRGELRRTEAALAVARAKSDVAARGLNATVITDFFVLVAAQRKLRSAQTGLREAERFVDITQKQEKGGEVAHADVIKAQISLEQRRRDLGDAQLAIDKAKIALGVLVFPQYREDFEAEDNLSALETMPAYTGLQSQASTTSPDIRAAQAGLREASLASDVARYAYLPSLAVDFYYGINANQFAANTDYSTQATGRSTLPNYQVPYRHNLGYSGQVTLNIPLWTWGATRSKIRQADLRRQQADYDLKTAQRQLQANLESYYREANVVQGQIDSLRRSAELSAESLRLTVLRYQAGEATALEVVDAQSTVAQARSAYDDGVVRYRTALANLQTVTGTPTP